MPSRTRRPRGTQSSKPSHHRVLMLKSVRRGAASQQKRKSVVRPFRASAPADDEIQQRHRKELASRLSTFDNAALARWDNLRDKQQKSLREVRPTFFDFLDDEP